MSELFRTPPISAVDPTFGHRIRDWMLLGARLMFWPVILLTLVSVALQLGVWHKEFRIAGPFAAETSPPRASLILEVPQEPPAPWWRRPLVGDDSGKPFHSFLKLYINGREMDPPHALHETIRAGNTTGFSHWGSHVIFSLPANVKNGPETMATLRYNVQPRSWLTYALAISSTLLGCLVYSESLGSFAERLGGRPRAAVLRAPYLILSGFCWAALGASVLHVASSLYALATGWALPTTALIRWSSLAQWAASNEPYFAYPLLMLAGLGTATTWLIGSGARHRPLLDSNEQSLQRTLFWCGIPIVTCAFIFCISAMWAGILRPGDPSYSNIGGLVPFSDANDHLAAAFDQVKDGVWNAQALRRPLAAAFRSVLLISSNFSLQSMLILQACLLAGAVCFATHAIIAWRGLWAGMAFFGLTYIYDRYFVPTTLTEPLGLFWALLSIPFLIKAFSDHSVKAALVAFAMTTVALLTRMGSMFTIPALMVWLVWQFGQDAKAKLRIAVATICILVGALGLNSFLQRAYGTGPSPATGNFAYTLCGLSMGTTWDGCPKKLAAENTPLQGSEDDIVRRLYSLAWKNLRADPGLFFRRLADGARGFATQFPDVLLEGLWIGQRAGLAPSECTDRDMPLRTFVRRHTKSESCRNSRSGVFFGQASWPRLPLSTLMMGYVLSPPAIRSWRCSLRWG